MWKKQERQLPCNCMEQLLFQWNEDADPDPDQNGAVNVGGHWRYDLYGKTKGLKGRIDPCCHKIFTAAQIQGIFSNFIKDPYIL